MVKKKELINMSDGELNEHIKETRMELMKANSQVKSGSVPKNPGKVRQMKKTIARILTIFNIRKNSKKDVKSVEVKKVLKTEKKEEKKKEESKKDE